MGKGNTNTGNEPAAEWVDVKSLLPWVDNPRKNDHAVQKVADSIKRFGFSSPIIARKENGEIIAGHTRLKAALLLGLDRVPVRYLDLDPADAHLLALADNKLGEIADWDDALVAEVLAGYEAEDCALAGFEDEAQLLPDVPMSDDLSVDDLSGESDLMVFRMVVPKGRKEDVERAVSNLDGAPNGQGERIGWLFLRLACSD